MAKQSEQGKLVVDYCKHYDKMQDQTLAKLIYKENPKLFKNAEHARNFVRGYRGHHGQRSRKFLNQLEKVPLNYNTTLKPHYEQVNTGAKVLILDIETAPILAFVWGAWQQNVQPNQIQSDWFVLTWAAKWLFEDKVYSGKVTPKEAKTQNDKRIIKGIWELVNEADIVIAHNGEKFDMPKLNSRFIIHDLMPPLPYQQIDTLKHIRRQFGFTHNKLDYVNQLLNLPRKKENSGMPLWVACYAGEQESINEMESYNIEDVKILEATYLRIIAWIKPHPNLGLFILDETQSRCGSCGSADLKEEGKPYATTANVYTQYRCNNCKSVCRKRTSDVTIKQRRNLTLNVPK